VRTVDQQLDEALEMTFPASDPVAIDAPESRPHGHHPERGEPGMNPTKNDLSQSTRAKVAALLNARLADAIDLQLQCKQAHWNVKGPQFIALHELFDQTHGVALESVDLLAERAVQLGGVALGTVQAVTAGTTLKPYPIDIADGRAHLQALSSALAEFGSRARAAIDECSGVGDQDSADVFTEISRGVDKQLWFVEAHLHGETGR
jgi:starvation-inducible DNA-binding protein